MLRISIVTPSFNQGEFLEECIDSILSQNYPNLDYIIMDGGSTDGSLEIIRKYERHLSYWQSCPDGGQYHALNAGFRRATGEVMAWLNSDDKYHPGALHLVDLILQAKPEVDWIMGRPTLWGPDGRLVSEFGTPPWNRHRILSHTPDDLYIQQESTFWRRRLWEAAGGNLDTRWRLAADFELWARFSRHAPLTGVDALLGGFRRHRAQKTARLIDVYEEEVRQILAEESTAPAGPAADLPALPWLTVEDAAGIASPALGRDAFSYFTYARTTHRSWLGASARTLCGGALPHQWDLPLYQRVLCHAAITQNLPKGARILELGRGSADLAAVLSRDYEYWVAAATAPGEPAPERLPGCRAAGAPIGSFSPLLPRDHFDLVFSVAPFGDSPCSAEQSRRIRSDVQRVLKRGGFALHCFEMEAAGSDVSVPPLAPHFFERADGGSRLPWHLLRLDPSGWLLPAGTRRRAWQTGHGSERPVRLFSVQSFWEKPGEVPQVTSSVTSPPPAAAGTPPERKPFMQQFEIDAMTAALRLAPSDADCLEWGSGNSTLYFSRLVGPERSWLSIEHDGGWAAEVAREIRKSGRSNVALHHIKNNLPFEDGVDDGTQEAFFDYVRAPANMMRNFGFILVDGRARTACMTEGWKLLDSAGIMALHDAQRPEYADGIPADSFLLRVRHEALVDRDSGNGIATLFMAKSAEVLLKLKEALSSLPAVKLELAHPQGIDAALTSAPATFTVETALGCDLECPECALGGNLITRRSGMMTFDRFRIIADKIRPFARYVLLHNWGEPLLNPDIFKIIAYTAQFARCNISTNGMCVTREKAEALIASGVSDIVVSIDGVSQEAYQRYRRGGDVEQAFSALALLVEFNRQHGNRVNIMPQFVVFEHNEHEMAEFEKRCAALALRPSFKAPYIRKGSTCFRYSSNPAFQRVSFRTLEEMDAAVSTCADAREVCTILVDGSVVICCNDHNGVTSFGNLFDEELMQIWNGLPSLTLRSAIVSGKSPKFCIDHCMVWRLECDDRREEVKLRFQRLQEQKASGLIDAISRASSVAAARADGEGFPVVVDRARRRPAGRENLAGRTSCLFLNTYYPAFLESHYGRRPELAAQPYLPQLKDLQSQCFGDSDFYSRGLIAAGFPAQEIVVNCPPLQQAWATEYGSNATGTELVVEQVRRISPDVLYVQDLNNTSAGFLEAARPYVRLIAGQVATPVSQQVPFAKYDLLFSSFPHYVASFRSMGLTSYYQPLAFDPRVLQRIPATGYGDRPIGCSFVGGISQLHADAYGLLEVLAEKTPIQFFGYGAETLPERSKVRERHHGEAWGKEMFRIIGSSRITVNRHGEVAGDYANNMRLFEATGCGALLITDYKENLDQLFEIGREIVAFRSPEECAALVNYYLAHTDEAEEIARAGQLRTLRDHTYDKRMEHTAEILSRHLRYRERKNDLPGLDPDRINYGHTPIGTAEITAEMTSGWQDAGIPARQRALVQHELELMYRGNPPLVFRVLADILKPLLSRGGKLLEIGCASGYYYEVLEYLLNRRLEYTGVDYSQPMIDMAREYYPKASFFAADGASLFFADRSFPTVISSGVLLHVSNYREHIFESARVAESFIVASRTPVCRTRPTQYLKKFAYGVQTLEIVFNEAELLREFALNGFERTGATEYHSDPGSDRYEVTYLFKRQGR